MLEELLSPQSLFWLSFVESMRALAAALLAAQIIANGAAFDFLKPRYWSDQMLVTKLLSGVPKGSKVLEIDCVDGAKNLCVRRALPSRAARHARPFRYYLPMGCDVKQWYASPPKEADRGPITMAANKLGLAVEVVLARASGKPPKLDDGAYDACFGVRCLERAYARGGEDEARRVVDAAMDACKPDAGTFLFLEDPRSEGLLAALLDEHPLVGGVEAAVENDAIVGFARRAPLAANRGMGEAKPKKKKKR